MQKSFLFLGVEIFSKSGVNEEFPDLIPFMKRETITLEHLKVLNKYKEQFLDAIQGVECRNQDKFAIFFIPDSKKIPIWNYYAAQSRGMVLQTVLERCVHVGLFYKHDMEKKDWPQVEFTGVFPAELEKDVFGVFSSENIIYFTDGTQIFEGTQTTATDTSSNLTSTTTTVSRNPLLCPPFLSDVAGGIPPFQLLPFDSYFFIFVKVKTEVQLVALRSSLNWEFQNASVVQKVAESIGVKVFTE